VWSLGVILFALLSCRLPFNDDEPGKQNELIITGQWTMPSGLSPEAMSLLRRILVIDPTRRITLDEIWRHPLVTKYDSLDDLQTQRRTNSAEMNRKLFQAKVPADIDTQTLRQLHAMWHSSTEAHIKQQLWSSESNDFKLFYWLLFNYRKSQLENFDKVAGKDKGLERGTRSPRGIHARQHPDGSLPARAG
jgi:serine/threonine protein kinase